MAAIQFSASGYRWHQSFLAQQQLAAERTFDPGNLPFFCCSGCPGIVPGAAEAGLIAPAQVALPAALGLPTHSYPPCVSFPPALSACSAAAFATAVNLFCTHCKTKQWPVPRSLLHRSSLWSSTGSGNPGLFHWSAARTGRAAAACLASGTYC